MSELIFKENSVTPATPAASYVKFYAKSDGLLYTLNDAGTELPVAGQKDPESKSIIIENPSNSEDLSFFFTDVAITITKMRAILVGSATPSVTWTIRHGTDRSATGAEVVTGGSTTTDTTTGSDITSFNDPTVVANSHVWIETTAQSGTVDSIIVTVFYTED
jgi:hypothetical protein